METLDQGDLILCYIEVSSTDWPMEARHSVPFTSPDPGQVSFQSVSLSQVVLSERW